MQISKLTANIPPGLVQPLAGHGGEVDVTDIVYDSREATPGCIFVAVKEAHNDGHLYIADAVARGAVAVVGEDANALRAAGVPAYTTSNAHHAMSYLADTLFGHPSRELDIVGITGTNGKTTTAHLVERLYAGLGFKTGRIGTLGVKIGDEEIEGEHTTPYGPDLQRTLRRMVDAGVQKVAMEVSSHALEQGRTLGTRFPVAVFTNLTQDHLDFHGSMEEYFAAKLKLFTEYEPCDDVEGAAILNADEPACQMIQNQTSREARTYGIDHPADLRAHDLHQLPGGRWDMKLGDVEDAAALTLNLRGRFNVYNALAAMAAVYADHSAGMNRLGCIAELMENITGAPGRFEAVDEGQDFAVIVDYAHTPDALQNVLSAAKRITPNGRVLSVVGCGGDRDRTKRPKMGRIAVTESDFAFITSDNPRTEDPEAIIRDIVAGLGDAANYAVEPDRHTAILTAIAAARTGDTVVIAGKGHEDYQIIGTTKHHFDDREVAREALMARRSHA